MDDEPVKPKCKAQLESLFVEGLNSGEPVDVDSEFWAITKADLKARLATEQAIQSGFDDIEAGRMKSAEEVHAGLRKASPE